MYSRLNQRIGLSTWVQLGWYWSFTLPCVVCLVLEFLNPVDNSIATCRRFATDYAKVGTYLSGVIPVGRVNVDEYPSYPQDYGVVKGGEVRALGRGRGIW
eukprot:TRINITY_DN10071_c0_g1_i3.p1 TRINITY_DN10071_c0_g1~~TRINITY_DN10071_c0_g1_i3.p1  ORF type:complete len:100 (+),score=11.49 TRINITY_DN10071_c0_g1_i3:178-477(+)